jgi:hypothetical protein
MCRKVLSTHAKQVNTSFARTGKRKMMTSGKAAGFARDSSTATSVAAWPISPLSAPLFEARAQPMVRERAERFEMARRLCCRKAPFLGVFGGAHLLLSAENREKPRL